MAIDEARIIFSCVVCLSVMLCVFVILCVCVTCFCVCMHINDLCVISKDVNDLLDHSNAELSDRLSRIGDNIVVKLVQWTRRLPFYKDISVNTHTSLLTNKWHELLVLTTSSYQAIHGGSRMGTTRSDGETAELHQEVSTPGRQTRSVWLFFN